MNIGAMISNFFQFILMQILGFVNQFIPLEFMYDANRVKEFVEETYATLEMIFIPGIIALVLGSVLGILSVATKKGGILENRYVYFVLDKFINFFRSIPFVILIAMLMGLSRLFVGSVIGLKGMYVPLVFGTLPFFARQVESALAEVDEGLVEASVAMANTPFQIITRVYLKESIPGIIRGISITLISLIGLTAMAGQVGGGGLGNFAIRYGWERHKVDATWVTVFMILFMVTIIQAVGNYLEKKTTH